MATRIAADFPCHVCLSGDRPRAFIDCGFQYYSFWFDDLGDLHDTLTEAVRHDGLPERAAAIVYERAAEAIGSYEDDDFGAVYDPPSGVTQRGLIDWPQAIIGLTALVYVAFVVQLAMWGVQWLYHAVN